jgi:hypothetical protein
MDTITDMGIDMDTDIDTDVDNDIDTDHWRRAWTSKFREYKCCHDIVIMNFHVILTLPKFA